MLSLEMNLILTLHFDHQKSYLALTKSSEKTGGGGGSILIGFKDNLIISELSDPSSEAEMVWAKLQIPGNKPLCLCYFYRQPNNNITPIAILNNFLSENDSPQILLAGDFNTPSVSWIDGTGQISPNPDLYGIDDNLSLLETINEFELDQLVTEPTHGGNILDLIFSSHPESAINIEVVPGVLDDEAVYFEFKLNNRPESDDIGHPIFLYNRGNITQLKSDMSDFQTEFLSSYPFFNSMQENRDQFKEAINNATSKIYIP